MPYKSEAFCALKDCTGQGIMFKPAMISFAGFVFFEAESFVCSHLIYRLNLRNEGFSLIVSGFG